MLKVTKVIRASTFLSSMLLLFCCPQTHVWANGIFLPEFVPGTFPLAANLQEVSKAAKEKSAADRCVNPQSLKISGDRVPEFPVGMPPIFAGHPLDPATGMYNARARNYDPAIGRFTTQDPLSRIPMPAIQAFAGNPYTYVKNAPTKFVDPLGLYEQPTNNAYNPYNSYSDPTPVSSWLDNNWATLSNGWEHISDTPNLDSGSAKSLMFQAQYSPIESLRNSTTLLGQSLRGIYDSINASIIVGMTLDMAVAATQDVWATSGMWQLAQLFQSGKENALDMILKSLNSYQQPEGITPGESFVPGADYASELAKALPDLAAAANLGLLGAPGSTLTGQSPWELPGGGVMSPEEGGVGSAVPGINTPVVSTGNQGQNDREPPPGAINDSNPSETSTPNVGDKVTRNWGGQSEPDGQSWTRDPVSEQTRDSLGLGFSNTGEFISQGTLKDTTDVMAREALPWGEFSGGGDEVLVPNPNNQIQLDSVTMPDTPLPDKK